MPIHLIKLKFSLQTPVLPFGVRSTRRGKTAGTQVRILAGAPTTRPCGSAAEHSVLTNDRANRADATHMGGTEGPAVQGSDRRPATFQANNQSKIFLPTCWSVTIALLASAIAYCTASRNTSTRSSSSRTRVAGIAPENFTVRHVPTS